MRQRNTPLKAFVKQEYSSPMKGKLKPCQKAAAKRKFKVYPSAYANIWASRHKC
jgi:hypothetical protein